MQQFATTLPTNHEDPISDIAESLYQSISQVFGSLSWNEAGWRGLLQLLATGDAGDIAEYGNALCTVAMPETGDPHPQCAECLAHCENVQFYTPGGVCIRIGWSENQEEFNLKVDFNRDSKHAATMILCALVPRHPTLAWLLADAAGDYAEEQGHVLRNQIEWLEWIDLEQGMDAAGDEEPVEVIKHITKENAIKYSRYICVNSGGSLEETRESLLNDFTATKWAHSLQE